MGARILKGLAFSAMAAVALAVVALFAVHTPWARTRVLAWATDTLRARYRLVLSAESLDYSLVSRRAALTGVRLAAEGHEAEPFFTASRLDAGLPASVYRGRVSFDYVTVDDGVVSIRRDAAGRLNLPSGDGGPPGAVPARLDIRDFELRNGRLHYVDTSEGVEVDLPGIAAALTEDQTGEVAGIAGRFALDGTSRLRYKDRSMSLAPVEARLGFDGSSVTLSDWHLTSPEIDAVIEGAITRVLDAPALALRVDGTVDLGRTGHWVATPVALAGRVRVDGTVSGMASAPTANLRARSAALTIGLERGVRLDGPLQVSPQGVRSESLRLTPSTGGELLAQIDVPASAAPLRLRAQWRNVDAQAAFRLGGLTPPRIASALTGRLTYDSGTARMTVSNRAAARARSGAVAVSGALEGTLEENAWSIEHAHHAPGASIGGHLRGTLNREQLARTSVSGHQDLRIPDVATAMRSAATVRLDLPAFARDIRGAGDASLDVGGTFGAIVLGGALSGRDLLLPSLGPANLTARVDTGPTGTRLSNVDVQRGRVTLRGDARIDARRGALSGAFDLSGEDIADVQDALPATWRVSGPVTAHATLGGTLRAFRLHASLTGAALSWQGQPVDRLAAEATLTPTDIDVTSLRLAQGAGALEGRVRYIFASSRYDAHLTGEGLTYTGSLLEPGDTHATIALQFDGAGSVDEPVGSATGRATVTGGPAATLVGDGTFTAHLRGDHATMQARVPSLGALVDATVGTHAPYGYRAVAVLNRLPLAPLAALTPALPDAVQGFASLTATSSGDLADTTTPTVFVNLQEVDARVGRVPVVLATPARAAWRGDVLSVDALDLAVGGGRLSASGEWSATPGRLLNGTFAGRVEELAEAARAFGAAPPVDGTGEVAVNLQWRGDPARTSATVAVRHGTLAAPGAAARLTSLEAQAVFDGARLTVSQLSGHVRATGIDGDFSARAEAHVPAFRLDAVEGALTVDRGAFMASGVPIAQERPSILTLSRGRLTATDVAWTVADNQLMLSGSVDFAPDEPTLDLSLDGGADLRALSAFMPTLAFDGGAAIAARITGTTRAPRINGEIGLESAEVAISEPRLVVSDLSGPIRLADDRVHIEGVTGQANGGAVTLGGDLRLGAGGVTSGQLDIGGTGVTIEFPRGLRSEVDASVRVTLDAPSPLVTGDVRVLRGAYTDTITLAALAASAATSATPAAVPTALDAVRLNVTLTTDEDVAVENNYGRFDAGGALRVVGTVGEPGMTGRIAVREGGQLFLAGRTFLVTRGDVSFTNLRRIVPEFNIAAEARVGSDNMTMALTGTLDQPALDLTSANGSKTPGELAAAIVGGRATAESALTLLSADVLGLTGRAIGLDALRVQRGDIEGTDFREDPGNIADETDPAARLTIAKRLRRNVEVTLSQNLRESGKTTVVVSYFVRPALEVRALSRDNATAGLAIRHQVALGSAEAPRRHARPDDPVISAVTFEGAVDAFEAPARRAIRSSPGRRFAFGTWQADLDRLRALLHARGFFEARVRGRRAVDSDGRRVALVFVVEPGPAATLDIEGVTLPETERRALELAWTRSGFDRFLIDDLSARLARYLVSAGYLGSEISGLVERPSAGVKRARLTVTPGTRVTRREVRFQGNVAMDRVQLRGLLTGSELAVESWVDPATLERTLQAAYQDAGYAQARVMAQPFAILGGVAALPVEIDEGVQTLIADVRWSGPLASRIPLLQEASGIKASAVYRAELVADARRRVERRYRSLGFASADVGVSIDLTADSTVVVTFVIKEGPQQVLASMTTEGARRTRESVIANALNLPSGQPVNPDDWAQARKRLYDTNLFRQVEIEPVAAGPVADGVQPVDALVTVQEQPSWVVRYGAQLEGERTATIDEFAGHQNLGLVAELKTPNLFGRAFSVGVFGQYQWDARDATVFLSSPRLPRLGGRATVYGSYGRDRLRDDANHVAAIADEISVSAEQRWRPRGVQIVGGYRFQRNHTFDPSPQPNDPFPLDFVVNLGRWTTGVVLDRRDDPLNGRRGAFSSLSWEQGAPWLVSDITNAKLLLQQFVFLPVGPVVLASRLVGGTVFGPDDLLPRDRFRAGGSTTVRGYGEDSLGPRDLFALPSGGETMLVINQEARLPVYRWVRAVAFVDLGSVVAKGDPFRVGSMKVGYGAGLRVSTPVGLVRVDFGIPGSALPAGSTRVPNTLSGGRWYFGIGHIF